MDPETKLSAARTRLVLDRPFLGALVLRLPLVEAGPWCKTVATDARAVYFNPEYVDSLSVDQAQFALSHEAMHCALSHFARRQHRDRKRWDLACDLAINPLLIADGLTPTPDALYLKQFEGMTAEEIYPCLDESEHMEPEDEHVYDQEGSGEGQAGGGNASERPKQGGSGGQNEPEDEQEGEGGGGEPNPTPDEGQGGQSEQDEDQGQGAGEGAERPQPLTEAEKEELSGQWQQRMAGAAQQAMRAGKTGGALGRMVDRLIQPELPWRALLARYLSATARDDYDFTRPSRREGDALLPSLRSHQVEVVVALDVSGSVGEEEMRQFVSEIDALKGQVRARVTLHACDARLAEDGPWVYEPWEPLALPREFRGGGGTDFRPVFEWLDKEGARPDLVLYFTDAQGRFPGREPPFPVTWLVKGKGPVPWGERIQLN